MKLSEGALPLQANLASHLPGGWCQLWGSVLATKKLPMSLASTPIWTWAVGSSTDQGIPVPPSHPSSDLGFNVAGQLRVIRIS